MKIVVAVKVVPDDQDITVAGDGTLDMSKAHQVVSAYDLNALEAAAQLAADVEGSTVSAITVGPAAIDDSKLKKNILARGIDDLYMAADDAACQLDARSTAAALSAMLGTVGDYSVIICGDGSADNYAQQVDVQLAARLGIPSVNGVVKIEPGDGVLVCERKLEDDIEIVEVSTPCVVAVSPDIALPRIPGMRDILAAGKKPMNMETATILNDSAVEVCSVESTPQADRKLDVKDASDDGAVEAFAQALKAALS